MTNVHLTRWKVFKVFKGFSKCEYFFQSTNTRVSCLIRAPAFGFGDTFVGVGFKDIAM